MKKKSEIIREKLFELQDLKYAEFQSKLTPTVNKNTIIGVRIPTIRKLAKQLVKEEDIKKFLVDLPHIYYDENLLHGLIIAEIKDYDQCVNLLDDFLPYIDNWAVCDTISPKIFKKHRQKLIIKIKEWSNTKLIYTCRFGIGMLMSHFLDEDFKPEYLNIPSSINFDEYYVKMMIAWFFATALAKQWESSIAYLENNKLEIWIHNKTITKACESYRITEKQKEYLKKLRR